MSIHCHVVVPTLPVVADHNVYVSAKDIEGGENGRGELTMR